MSRWLGEGGGLTAYHTNLQVNSNNNSHKSNSYHGEHFVNADLFNVSYNVQIACKMPEVGTPDPWGKNPRKCTQKKGRKLKFKKL